MKKLLSYIHKFFIALAIIFAISGVAFPQETSAQIPGSPRSEAECVQQWRDDNPNQSVPESVATSCRIQFSNVGQIAATQGGCKVTEFGCQIIERVVPGIAEILLKFASLLTGFAAIILNGVVYLTVVKISENYSNIPAIDTAWKTIRDLANMGFIFILLYAAIQTIIGVGKDTQKLIVKVIVIAVLINFSLFFTKLIIDASNILAITFYDAIAPEALNAAGGFNWTQKGLSDAFMQHLSLQSLYKVAKISTGAVITTGIMGSIMLLVAAFVFFAVAILFIIRYVVLILVLILSPIAFLSFVLPQLEKYRSQWWEALSGQAFFAPIYFALTWVTLSVLGGIMSSFGKISGTTAGGATALGNLAITGSGAVDSGGGGAFAMLINFIVIIVFLIVSLIIAKEWANKAPGGVSKLTSWAMGAAGGATLGMAGRFGRLAAGGATMSPGSAKYKRLEAQSAEGGFMGAQARLRLATADKLRTSSFDMRGGRIGGALAGAGIDAGKAQEGGYDADKKAVREFFERPGTESRKKRVERARKAQGELDIMAGVGPAAIPLGTRTPAQQAAVDAMDRAITNASDKEIEAIVDSNRNLLRSQEFANSISVKQLDALNKSDKFTEAEKDQLKGNRFAEINTALGHGGAGAASVRQNIRRLSDTELEMINPAHLGNADFVSQMQPSQIDAINKSTKFTTAQKGNLRTSRRAPLMAAIAAGNVAGARAVVREMGHKEVAGLDMVVLGNPTMLQVYTPQLLTRMIPEMNSADIPTLRAAIIAAGAPASGWLASPAGAVFS